MKNLTRLMLVVAMAFAVNVVVAQITGSAHDFSADGYGTTEICAVCHTPHNADVTVAEAPLWDHELSAVGAYTLYSSSTFDAAMAQPAGLSKLCLGCHDGTVAIENFGGVTTGTTTIDLAGTGTADLGTTLADDHPIGITYDAALAGTDGGLHDPTATVSGLGGNIDADMLFGPGNDQLECASCHDVHNAAGGGPVSLLRKDNNGSALCLTCHDK